MSTLQPIALPASSITVRTPVLEQTAPKALSHRNKSTSIIFNHMYHGQRAWQQQKGYLVGWFVLLLVRDKYCWLVYVREKYCSGWKFTIVYDKP